MLDFPRWKIWLVSLTVIVGVLLSIPSFLPERITEQWPASLRPRINLGLDLSGGSHILLEADTKDIAKQRLATMEETVRSEEHTSELQSLMRISYAVFCLKKKKKTNYTTKSQLE